jgi:hypothetical protein
MNSRPEPNWISTLCRMYSSGCDRAIRELANPPHAQRKRRIGFVQQG